MATTITRYTAEDLWRMPGDEPWEIWNGELRKVPSAGGMASGLAHWIGALISIFVRPRGLGWVTGADGSYILSRDPDTVVVPDVAFIAWDRLPGRRVPDGYIPVPPDLAVEVISPTDRPGDIARKQEIYRRAGVPLVWWVDPARRTVSVYLDGKLAEELGEGDELDGGEILLGFRLSVAEIFRWSKTRVVAGLPSVLRASAVHGINSPWCGHVCGGPCWSRGWGGGEAGFPGRGCRGRRGRLAVRRRVCWGPVRCRGRGRSVQPRW